MLGPARIALSSWVAGGNVQSKGGVPCSVEKHGITPKQKGCYYKDTHRKYPQFVEAAMCVHRDRFWWPNPRNLRSESNCICAEETFMCDTRLYQWYTCSGVYMYIYIHTYTFFLFLLGFLGS